MPQVDTKASYTIKRTCKYFKFSSSFCLWELLLAREEEASEHKWLLVNLSTLPFGQDEELTFFAP